MVQIPLRENYETNFSGNYWNFTENCLPYVLKKITFKQIIVI